MINAIPETIVLTIPQLAAAHALARAHGHLWATTLEAADLPATAEGIRAAVGALHGDDIGIFYPEVNAYEYEGEPTIAFIVHTTGSGRLRWTVNSDGDTEITVSRPGGDLFNFRVEFGSDCPVDVFVNDLTDECGIGQRHVDAAAKALSALTGRTLDQSLSALRYDGIAACGPAAMAEKISNAVFELNGWHPELAQFESQLTWHSNAAEMAAQVVMVAARDHHRVDPTRPWVRAAQDHENMAETRAAWEEDLASRQ